MKGKIHQLIDHPTPSPKRSHFFQPATICFEAFAPKKKEKKKKQKGSGGNY